MRIVHVARQYHPAVGGMESVVAQLARRQVEQGHDVRVVTLNRLFGSAMEISPDRAMVDGVEVVRVGFLGSTRYPLALGVMRHVRDADIVHVHGVDFFFDFLALTRPFHRRKMIATTHGGFFHTDYAAGLKRFWFSTVTRISARAYRYLIACSPSDHAIFEGLRHPGLHLIENGADTTTYRDLAARRAKTILYFGRLAPNKGLDRLLLWFAALRREDEEWRLILAGRPAGISVAELRETASALLLGDAVTVYDSPDAAQLRALIAQASVFASAARFEGFGIAAVEAASAGLLPVLSRIPPFLRLLSQLGQGMGTDFGEDPAEIRRFLEIWRRWAPSDREALITTASRQFGWDRAVRAYAALSDTLYPRRRRIGPVAVEAISQRAALDIVKQRIAAKSPALITFCNAHTVNVARTTPELRDSLSDALVLNDGIGLDLASRWLYGAPFPANLNGTDFTPALLADSERPLRLYLLGSSPGVAEQAARVLAARYPRHSVVGVQHGYFRDDESAGIVADIRRAAPDLILVGMGQPRQELWATTHLRAVPATTLCIGAFLDFTAGVIPRAPELVRNLRMEWAYRLLLEPRRLASRYLLGNFTFLAAVARSRRSSRPVEIVGERSTLAAPDGA